jgi:hypothetical protein
MSLENCRQCALSSALRCQDHLRHGHFYLSGKGTIPPHRLLDRRENPIERCPVERDEVRLPAAFRKSRTSRHPRRFAVRPVQFTGDAVQPADHRSKRVETAAVVNVQRTHRPHRRRFCRARPHGSADRFGPFSYGKLSLSFKGSETICQIEVFNLRVMVKQRQAAVVFTTPALETVAVGRVFVGPVHGSVQLFQPDKMAADTLRRR